jgi:hypothetical protein
MELEYSNLLRRKKYILNIVWMHSVEENVVLYWRLILSLAYPNFERTKEKFVFSAVCGT